MIPQFIRRVLKWRYKYRNENTGRYISKSDYDALPERDRMKHRERV